MMISLIYYYQDPLTLNNMLDSCCSRHCLSRRKFS